MAQFAVVLDACVLYPFALRDVLIQLATTGLYRARWSDDIHEEWISNLLARGWNAAQLGELRALMERAVPDASVSGYRPLIDTLAGQGLPDDNDAHVIAAAVRANADMIVTWNVKHFPKEVLSPYHIEVQDPDDFLLNQFDLDAAKLLQTIKTCRQRLNNPSMTPDEYLTMLEKNRLTNTVLELRQFADVGLI